MKDSTFVYHNKTRQLWDGYSDVYEYVASKIDKNIDYGAIEDQLMGMRSEEVIYSEIHPAEIVKFLDNGKVKIKFSNPDLIPPEMDVEEETLRQRYTYDRVVNPAKKCPKCAIPWKETMLARFSCFDCPSCGAKKEDYVS